ncbi:hypothetical protein PILCRDRAFT_10796 [Piloderma croceum F 1598]|uniref:Uncharacterized protein n=1 Tax=Piloderma croceum (strain F 1598) TaxID=765440 RepID=A0A0C3BNF0_PILCF|nr:hypothetical protein PILCRDRAFT_10796 [Piloderma croceum F 1598]
MSVPHHTRVLPRVPFKFRRKSLSSADDMPSLHSYNRNDSSSPASSSPLPPTPFASSSPPAYPHIHASPAYLSRRGPSDYSDDYEDISALWPLARGARLNSLYASKHAAFPSHSDDEPHWTSKSDASGLHVLENKHLSPDDTDEEDEYEAFGDIKRQTCFATSSERGRWKSSPIPIKTYSHPYASTSLLTPRSIEETMSGLAPLNITGKSNSHTHSQWRRPSTASSISEQSMSPTASTLPSWFQEPSSPLPPSSPPTSPMSATFSMPESDDTTEEDMLVDSGDEHQSEHVSDTTNSQSLSLHDAAHPESDSEHEEDSLIPAIATLDFITAYSDSRSAPTPHKPLLQSPKPTPIHESIVLPYVTTMPTPETTPVAQERDPTFDVVVRESLPTPPKSMTPPASVKPDVDASASTKQPLVNKKNELHPGQTTVPVQPLLSHAPSTHIPMPMPMPTADMAYVDPIPTIPTSSATTRQPLANKKNEPHPGQTTVPEQPPLSHAPSTRISIPIPTPVDVDMTNVDTVPTIPTSPATTRQPLANKKDEPEQPPSPSTHIPIPTPTSTAVDVDMTNVDPIPTILKSSATDLPSMVQIAPTVEGCKAPSTEKTIELLPAQSNTTESPLPMDLDAVSAGPSRAATPSSESTLPKDGSVNQPPLANEKNQFHPGLTTDCAQIALSMNVDDGAVVASLQTNESSSINNRRMSNKDGSGNLAAVTTDKVQKEAKVVGAKAKKVDGDLPGGHSKETGNKEEVAKKVIKPPRPSKPIIRKEAAPKAGPSKQAPVVDITRPKEIPLTVGAEGKEPVKRKKKAEESGEGPVRKKKKVRKDESAVVEASETAESSRNTDPSSSKPKTKKAKASQIASTSSKSVSDHSPPPTLDFDSVQLTETQGMIIESFAVSRASALPASTLYRSITDNRPSLKSVRSEEQWIKMIEMALEEGQSDSGVFGKVESSFKDETDRALEAKWFYVPERDVDQERASLISSMMPRAAKRTETKKYKQYYYQPLDKISRWDPEDDP